MNTNLGLLGMLGIWLTMAMMPLAELLALSASEATFLRGLSGFLIIGLYALFRRGIVIFPDRNTTVIVVLFVSATLCLFKAINAWGTNYSALFLDLAVIVPIIFVLLRGQIIDKTTYMAFVLAILGTMLALRIFSGSEFNPEGFFWSIGALIANGLFIEYAVRATQSNWNKVFWMSLGLVLFGIGSLFGIDNLDVIDMEWIVLALVFSFATGVLNFYCAFVAFANLKPVAMGMLLLLVTPIIILSSYIILGKSMGLDQLIGVTMTLVAGFIFGHFLRRQNAA